MLFGLISGATAGKVGCVSPVVPLTVGLRLLAAVHGGGEIRVRSVRTLTAAVNGGGLVRYWGDPAVTTVIQGGGAVQRGH